MSIRILFLNTKPTGIRGGIAFTDGVAVVESISPNVRTFLELSGATILEEPDAVDPALIRGEKLLTDCTVPELREIAAVEGITLPPKAKKDEILRAFVVAFHEED